ncbi:MAG TPA: hypothetical protein VH476_10060 [Solirubrobacterales bacterium]
MSAGVVGDNSAYLAAWERGWHSIEGDSVVYRATSTSPGACNKGATKVECFVADRRTARDLGSLEEKLRTVSVPDAYQSANHSMVAAISTEREGLALRMRSLGPGSHPMAIRDQWFQEANDRFAKARILAERGYAAYPEWARPTPAPTL